MTKINGGQEEGTDYLVDGITTNRMENGSGSFDIVAPSVEAVNEFHISLSGLPAELGRTTGGLANFNTKSGTNSYHGALFDIYKNAGLDANNWFNNGYLARNPGHRHRDPRGTEAPGGHQERFRRQPGRSHSHPPLLQRHRQVLLLLWLGTAALLHRLGHHQHHPNSS